MRWPFAMASSVEYERARADRIQADYRDLVDKVCRMRRKGFDAASDPKPAKITPSGPSPEAAAAQRMHAQLVEDLAKDLEKIPGVPPSVAKAEANRLRAIALDGSLYDPPV